MACSFRFSTSLFGLCSACSFAAAVGPDIKDVELMVVAVAPAIAIHAATGTRLRSLPLNAEVP